MFYAWQRRASGATATNCEKLIKEFFWIINEFPNCKLDKPSRGAPAAAASAAATAAAADVDDDEDLHAPAEVAEVASVVAADTAECGKRSEDYECGGCDSSSG